MRHYDAIIVGGGPAGSSVARWLSSDLQNKDVLLIEKLDEPAFSRYQRMCGEGISRRGLIEESIETAGLERNAVGWAEERWPGGVTIRSHIDGSIIDRTKLIAKLREPFTARGGEVVNDAVVNVRHEESGFTVECSGGMYSCNYLVGADGAHSVVRKKLFGIEPAAYMRVVQYVIEGPMENELHFIFDQRYDGKYRWEFPSGKYIKIGFPEGSDDVPSDALEVHRRSIPIGRLERIVDGQACLVGDAAGQANPVTFGGIRNSLAAGRVAATAIGQGDMVGYERAWERSPLSDRVYFDVFTRLRSMSNPELGRLVEPFRFGPNISTIMRELMNSDDFRVFYRSFVRKMDNGW